MANKLYLLKLSIDVARLVGLARQRQWTLRDFDEGYACHCVMRELWQEKAPTPFVLRPRGATLETWGYSNCDAPALVDHARAFGDPATLRTVGDLAAIASKEMPEFAVGRRLGFSLRACPVVRLAKERRGYKAGSEIDAFLASCLAVEPSVQVSREAVYRDWLAKRLGQGEVSGASLESARIVSMTRERLLRRTQGQTRVACRLERPDVRFEGTLVVTDGARFSTFLAHGVGRHRAFGFGAMLLTPPEGRAEG